MIPCHKTGGGDLYLDEDTKLTRIISGSITVGQQVHASLRNITGGDIIALAGSRVEIHGMVRGNLVIENGASVRVFGIVGGAVRKNDGDLRRLGGSCSETGGCAE